MNRKDVINWILGLVLSAFGICLCTKSDLGLSMIGACPYILHRKLVETWAWFSQGTAEYVFEAILLVGVTAVVRRFKPKWLLSFVTAVVVGFIIDGWFLVLGGNGPYESIVARIIAFVCGMCITSLGVAFFFRTRMPLEVYELAVTEFSERYGFGTKYVKLGFDVIMLVIALLMDLILMRSLVGIGIGTIVMTLCNSFIIAFCGKYIDRFENNRR